jgi:hypothetical protein
MFCKIGRNAFVIFVTFTFLVTGNQQHQVIGAKQTRIKQQYTSNANYSMTKRYGKGGEPTEIIIYDKLSGMANVMRNGGKNTV